ncbi:MAG: endonuclease III domain-containing protein [Syntrophobacteraceae bacterium]
MRKDLLLEIYHTLLKDSGPQNRFPAEPPFEAVLSAILTQNTAWSNVAAALANLRQNGLLRLDRLSALDVPDLAPLLRPTGFFRQKAQKIKAFCDHVTTKWNGSLEEFLSLEMEDLRGELLTIRGIGRETADSIVLYAAGKPSFVVDAHTWRIFSRHAWVEESILYDDLREYFLEALEPDVELFQEFHAQLDRIGQSYCRRKPLCESCPLNVFFDA